MRGMELVINLHREKLMPHVSDILHAFYENNILCGRVILYWGSENRLKTVGKEVAEEIHANAIPFLTWFGRGPLLLCFW